jgi:hypothetical protein
MQKTVDHMRDLSLGSLEVGKHRLRCRVAQVRDQVEEWTPLVVVGKREGPTVLVMAGIHGDEYEGIRAIHGVFDRLDPDSLAGRFVGIPIVHGPAYRERSRIWSGDGQNLARVFPGKADGTLTEQFADVLHRAVFPQVDLICDLHSAGMHYEIYPLAGYQLGPELVGELQMRAAVAFGLPLVWGTPAMPGRSLSSAADCGKPAIYVEMPGMGLCRPGDVRKNVDGVQNVLAMMSMLKRSFPTSPVDEFVEDESAEAGHLQAQCVAEQAGLFLPAVEIWQAVRAGDLVGRIVAEDGSDQQDVRAEHDGRVLCLRRTPAVDAGDFCGTVIAISEEESFPRS